MRMEYGITDLCVSVVSSPYLRFVRVPQYHTRHCTTVPVWYRYSIRTSAVQFYSIHSS